MSLSVHIENLTKQYSKGTKALNGVNLEIESGMFGLLGPNGAGKTTLMRILATLLTPTSGRVVVGGKDPATEAGAIRSILGYLPQDFNTYRHLSVAQVLDYVALLKGLNDTATRRREVERVLAQVHLHDRRKAKVKELSGGMKQRLGIGQALLGDPRFLIVDEPTAGLDPEERIRFRNLLADISGDRVVLLSTHIVGDVESSCSRLAVLDKGVVLFTGTPGELAEQAQGKVWELETSLAGKEQLPAISRVVATRRTVDAVQLRVLSPECPLPGARLAEPGLEEGYLTVVGVQGGAA